MKIKRFFAPDIRQAIRMVREEQGPDAVILSNRKVDGGVEIVAARDFDEQQLETRLKVSAAEGQERLSEKKESPAAFDRFAPNSARMQKTGETKPAPEVNRSAAVEGYAAQKRSMSESKVVPPRKPVLSPEKKASPVKPDMERSAVMDRQPLPGVHGTQASTLARNIAEDSMASTASGLAEIRREMREMKALMNTRLSEFAWNSAAESNPLRIELLKRLSTCGFSRKVAFELVDGLRQSRDIEDAWQELYQQLSSRLPVHKDPLLDQGGIIALVGPTGVGKTTTIAKLAARFRLTHGAREIALISTDNYRIGAHEQLTTYARILDVPVRSAHDAEGLRQALNYFVDKRLILIDTAGIGPHDERLKQQFAVLQNTNSNLGTYLVMSANTQQRGLSDVLCSFAGYQPVASILTKLDEASAPAAAVSQLLEHNMPISFITDGQQVPEDLHMAMSFDLAAACLSPGDEKPLTDNASEGFDYEEWAAYGYV